MKVNFGYSDSDDRMWIRAGSDTPLWWVTRRLALRLIREWAALMERTLPERGASGSDAADDAAGDSADGELREAAGARVELGGAADSPADRLLREHRAALSAPRQPPPGQGGDGGQGSADDAPAPPGASALVYSVDLGTRDGRIRLVLRSAGHRQAISVPRDDGHRLLAAFVSRCRRNGWLEARLPAWLEPAAVSAPGSSAQRPGSG